MIEKIFVEQVKNVFNHCFVTDVKPAICWNDIFLYDPSIINQLIDNEDLINKR